METSSEQVSTVTKMSLYTATDEENQGPASFVSSESQLCNCSMALPHRA